MNIRARMPEKKSIWIEYCKSPHQDPQVILHVMENSVEMYKSVLVEALGGHVVDKLENIFGILFCKEGEPIYSEPCHRQW